MGSYGAVVIELGAEYTLKDRLYGALGLEPSSQHLKFRAHRENFGNAVCFIDNEFFDFSTVK